MKKKHMILLRLLGGGIFSAAVFFMIMPQLGRTATVGIILAFGGFYLVQKGE
ncbi:MAG: hypothetical protein U9P42_08215 [Candidatus Fermentibacteria bacterium]|nr:hypothetical protein [Candidatus Fermentibacteria bacterium]